MSDLGLGGGTLPPNWGIPSDVYIGGSYRNDGVIWMGKQAVTVADIVALAEATSENVKIDWRSLVGLYHRSWTTFFNQHKPGATPMGGEGSKLYELKLVGEAGNGVDFAEKAIWYTNADGHMVSGIPPNAGAYHMKYVGDGYYDAYEGPEPGSVAATMLGDGEYYWDAERALYDIKF